MIKESCMPGILTWLLLSKRDNICRMYGTLVKELRCSFLECLKKSQERLWERWSEFCMSGVEIIHFHIEDPGIVFTILFVCHNLLIIQFNRKQDILY